MKSAHPLTLKQENVFWARSIFSVHTAEGLLKREQYSSGYDQVGRCFRFMGHSSKNVQGGLLTTFIQSNLKT